MDNNTVIAFDLDDTLYKEREYVRSGQRAVAMHIAKVNHADFDAEDLFERMATADNAFDEVLDLQRRQHVDNVISIDEMINIYRHHQPTISLSDNTRRTLSELVDRGYTLALITDGRDYTQRNKINALGLTDFVKPEAIIISEEVGDDKNSPLPFNVLVDRLGHDRRYIYVGDNPSKDFHHPNLMGWDTYMLADVNHVNIHTQDLSKYDSDYHPQHVITDITKLLTI
jgi:putative hydrolase of the HAD superfamily